jgi:hypothetical protein
MIGFTHQLGSMTRYFMHLHASGDLTRDEEGREYLSFADARRAAVHSGRSMMADDLLRGQLRINYHIELVSDAGHVTVLPFEDLVAVQSQT